MKVIAIILSCDMQLIGFALQGVDINQHQPSIFYLTGSLIRGGYYLVNC